MLQRDYTRGGTPHGNYTHLTLGNRSNWLEGGIRSEDGESWHGYMGRLVWCNSANAYPYDVTSLADTRAFLASWLDGYATLAA